MRTFDDLNSCDLFWMDQTKKAFHNSHFRRIIRILSATITERGQRELCVKFVLRTNLNFLPYIEGLHKEQISFPQFYILWVHEYQLLPLLIQRFGVQQILQKKYVQVIVRKVSSCCLLYCPKRSASSGI